MTGLLSLQIWGTGVGLCYVTQTPTAWYDISIIKSLIRTYVGVGDKTLKLNTRNARNGKGFPEPDYQAGFPFAPANWVFETKIT